MDTETESHTQDINTNEGGAGGEITLSVEETNKLRISLGLKPLEEDSETTAKEEKARFDEKKKDEQRQKIREKLRIAQEKRQEERFFENTKTLGEADSGSEGDGDDDIATWIQKTRKREDVSKATEKEQESKIPLSTPSSSDDEKSEPEEGIIVPEIAGKKIKHKASDIKIGETMILTLEDQPILNQKGELNAEDDALENVLKAEDSRRRKAYKASKPNRDDGFDMYGNKRDLLSKYDEEEEEAMTLDPVLDLQNDAKTRQLKESLETTMKTISDFAGGENEEDRPAKRRKKRLRKKTESEVLDIVADLEAQKDSMVVDWEADHGSRLDRKSRFQQKEEDSKAAKEEQNKKFDRALEKANLEALKLKFHAEDAEEEREMFDALARAQLMASKERKDRFKEVASEAKPQSAHGSEIAPENKNLMFTDTSEFCRIISAETQESNKQAVIKDEDFMKTDETEIPKEKSERRRHIRSKAQFSTLSQDKNEVKQEETVLREPILGSGLAAALNTLREKGDLKQRFEWVGRTNDMKKSRLIGVDDFYTCGETEDSYEKSIETALTRKDALGRVLTPKEAFRAISYAFHGKGPSQKTLEKRRKKMNDDYLANRINLDQQDQLTRLKAVQKVQENPYVVLTGTGQIGKELREEKKKTSKKAKAEARAEFPSLTPILNRSNVGGGTTPLEGKKKVEAMLGMESKE